MLNFENLDKFMFQGVGKYNIPQIDPVQEYPEGEFIPANYHYTAKDPGSKVVHFFVDDYQFIRHWNQPDKYVPKLAQIKAVCAPDFSTYTDIMSFSRRRRSTQLRCGVFRRVSKSRRPKWAAA